jgi:hypothetical protein
MNKIERAIYDAKLHIKDLERENLITISKIQAFKDMLLTLEAIESSEQIPHNIIEQAKAMQKQQYINKQY